MKEVAFYKYCPNCMYCKQSEAECPCYECLGISSRANSNKPHWFKPRQLREKNKGYNEEKKMVLSSTLDIPRGSDQSR